MSDLDSYPDYVWWVTPGLLAGMSRPPLEDLAQLYQAGMRGIVSVMDEPSGINEYREAGFQALWLPITGGKAPTIEQVMQFVQFAEPLLESHQPVVVHCTSGNRRTGTLLAAYLVAKGEEPESAITQCQALPDRNYSRSTPYCRTKVCSNRFFKEVATLTKVSIKLVRMNSRKKFWALIMVNPISG